MPLPTATCPLSLLALPCTALYFHAGLLEFLAYEPYHHAPVWRGLLQHLYERQSVGGLLSLRALLRGVMLRRSKANVGECMGGRERRARGVARLGLQVVNHTPQSCRIHALLTAGCLLPLTLPLPLL